MTVKLSDAQLVMLSGAAQREDLCLTAPEKMKGAILAKVGEKLVKLGLVREVRAKAGTPIWRQRSGGATLPSLIEATGWLAHTTRAALTDLRKRGYAVIRERVHGGERSTGS